MTLDEFCTKYQSTTMLYAKDLQPLIKISPDRIRYYARNGELPFPCILSGDEVKFPKAPFMKWFFGEEPSQPDPEREALIALIDSLKALLEGQKIQLQMLQAEYAELKAEKYAPQLPPFELKK